MIDKSKIGIMKHWVYWSVVITIATSVFVTVTLGIIGGIGLAIYYTYSVPDFSEGWYNRILDLSITHICSNSRSSNESLVLITL